MKKYYDLPKSKIVAMLDWAEGYGTLIDAIDYFKHDNFREVTKKEFNHLSEKYMRG